MSDGIELKFPFGEQRDDSPWPVEQEPTDLLALWPLDDKSPDAPPTQTEVIAAMREYLGEAFEVLEEVEPPSPDIRWSFLARLPGEAVPVMIWAQEAMDVPPGELGDAQAESCRWTVGLETLLDTDDPLSSYIALVSALAGSFPQSPAVIDINSTNVHARPRLDDMLGLVGDDENTEMVEPAADELWTIHAVQAEGDAGEAGECWLHTHGLSRCGFPELDMVEVPAKHVATAAELLNDLAALLFEFPPTAPGEPYEVGDGLTVTLQPWQEVVGTMKSDSPGGAQDRTDDENGNPHAGVRAVVCSAEKRGSFREVWTWPREIIERLENDEATIYMTHRATQRQSRLARKRWGDLATAFAAAQKSAIVGVEQPRAVFLLKAGFAVNGSTHDDEQRVTEHLWFEVHRFNGEDAEATLINQPVSVPSMKRGDRVSVKRDDVSDWQVQTAAGSFGPQDVPMLWQAIDALKSQESGST